MLETAAGNGFKYSDGSRRRCGVHAMLLRAGEAGARVVVKAKGENLPVPPLPLPLSARAQLQAGNGECWESVFSAAGVTKNDAERFKSRAD